MWLKLESGSNHMQRTDDLVMIIRLLVMPARYLLVHGNAVQLATSSRAKMVQQHACI